MKYWRTNWWRSSLPSTICPQRNYKVGFADNRHRVHRSDTAMQRIFSAGSNSKKVTLTSSFLLLTCALSGCDLPGVNAQQAKSDSSAANAQPDALRNEPVNPSLNTNLDFAVIDKGDEPAPIDENPPIPSDVEITPMENAGHPEGNAELAIRYENSEVIGDAVGFSIDKREYVLKRDQKDPKRFAAMIDFDFDQFQEEQESRKRQIAEAEVSTFPVFDGRELVGEERFEFIDPEELRMARDKSIAVRIRPSQIALPLPPSLDPSKTLMITDLSVVQDPDRTYDVCGNTGNPNGAWTFNTLMTAMANKNATYVDPSDFVESWLQSWNVPHTINSFPVPARTSINARVLNSWPRLSNGKLDLTRSPMRLLAIVNRVDLRSTMTSPSRYGGSTGIPISAGEGRFVFGVVDRRRNGGCSTMDFTVILEYGVPINQCTAIRSYAQQWSGLGNITLGSAAFNPALQAITDKFTLAGVDPSKPNGSAINQIRTNEIALVGYGGQIDPGPVADLSRQAAIPQSNFWELREFKLEADKMLHIVSTKNTPHHSLNNTPLLADFINSGLTLFPAIHQLQPFLTGSNFNFSVADNAVWNAPGIIDPQRRHEFSLNTCSACHGGETRYNGTPAVTFPVGATPETRFVHITPRNFNVQTHLSKFLTGTGTLSSPLTFAKKDPIEPTPNRSFGDLLRRKSDLAALSVESCRSTAILQEALFRQVAAVH
jgi:hypothetical protein